jgi:alpha-L-arabinofuranosidase
MAIRGIIFLSLTLALSVGCNMAVPDSKAVVTVDLEEKGAPISKYVYGQFIEHLGQCIYGGIWAEMLEDRKFYFPVEGDEQPWKLHTPRDTSWEGSGIPYEVLSASPWLIIGDRAGVSMDRNDAYVGEHSPRIQLPDNGSPAGFYQERLGLEAGKDYTGRIVIQGSAEAVPVEISLIWGPGGGDRQTVAVSRLEPGFQTIPLSFTAGQASDNARLEIVGKGGGYFKVGAVSLMPADNVQGFRRDTLQLMKELNSPVYRWPGGNFVSGYDWEDGIGDPDKRPPRKNPAWKGIEHNDVGMHEFMELCRLLDTEPMIAVNTGLGDAESAWRQVEYANGSTATPMGKWRAQNGAPEPFAVKWWCVGNEMYGDWQLGHMPLSEYVKKHNAVAELMRKVDPGIQLIAVGNVGPWTEGMLEHCADHMELISEHFYVQEKQDVVEHVALPVRETRRICEAHREYRQRFESLAGKDIQIAMDEYNYWYGAFVFGELGTRYFLKDGLGIAATLHEFFRHSDIVFMANYAQTVNVIGCIKTSKTAAEFETTGLVLKLYGNHYGTIPVRIEGDTGDLDVHAALSEDGKKLTLAVVNPLKRESIIDFRVGGGRATGTGKRWVITGENEFSHNDPGAPRQVDLTEEAVSGFTSEVRAPRLSVVLYELNLE